jgi:hypothetical protein
MTGAAMSREPPLSAQLILRLQTTSGNRAVQRLLQRQSAPQSADEDTRGRSLQCRPTLTTRRGEARAKWWRRLPRLFRKGRKTDAGS